MRRTKMNTSWKIVLAVIMRCLPLSILRSPYAKTDTSRDIVEVLVPERDMGTNFPTCYMHTTGRAVFIEVPGRSK